MTTNYSERKPGAIPLGGELRMRVRALVHERGEIEAVHALGISRGVLERSLAGLPIRPGSALLIEMMLEQLAERSAK